MLASTSPIGVGSVGQVRQKMDPFEDSLWLVKSPVVSSTKTSREIRSVQNGEFSRNDSNSSFVHTTAGSFPVVDASKITTSLASEYGHVAETQNLASENMEKMLQEALAISAKLSMENVKLESANQAYQDQVMLLKQVNEATMSGPDISVMDASISALRGRLLDKARKEQTDTLKRLSELETTVKALQFQTETERMNTVRAKERETTAIKQLNDIRALSDARARAIDRLDADLVKSNMNYSAVQKENVDLMDKVRFLEMRLEEAQMRAQRAESDAKAVRESQERLVERVAAQRLDLQLAKSRAREVGDGASLSNPLRRLTIAAETPPKSISPQTSPLIDQSANSPPLFIGKSDVAAECDSFRQKEQHFAREIAVLREELNRLRSQSQRSAGMSANNKLMQSSRVTEVLRERLVQAITELKLTSEDRAKERAYMNGILASYAARIKSLELKIRKEPQYKREIKYYKYVAKKSQAELAAHLAQERSLRRDGAKEIIPTDALL